MLIYVLFWILAFQENGVKELFKREKVRLV